MWGEPFFDHKEYSSRIIFSLAWLGGLNKLHNVSYRFTGTLVDSVAISDIQYGFLGVGAGGVFFGHKEYSSRISWPGLGG